MSSKENALSIANNIFHLLGTIEKVVGLNLPKPHNYMGIETQGSSVAPTIGLGKIIEEHSSLKEHPNVKLGLEVLEVVKMVVAEVAPLLMANEHLLVPIQTLGVLAAVTTQFINIVIMVETFIQEDSKGISEVVDFFKTVVTALKEKIAKIKSELQEIEKLFTVSKGSQSYISFEKHSVAVNTFTVKVACCQLEIEQCKSLIKSIIPKMTTTISQLSGDNKLLNL